jgi:transposase-like protein
MAKGTNRDKGRQATWRRVIQEHAGSGLSIRQFCRDNDLTESGFYFWRRELQRRETQRPQQQRRQTRPEQQRRPSGTGQTPGQAAAAPAFVPVSVSQAVRQSTGGIEIILLGGARIHVAGGVDRQALADVVAVLREAHAC